MRPFSESEDREGQIKSRNRQERRGGDKDQQIPREETGGDGGADT